MLLSLPGHGAVTRLPLRYPPHTAAEKGIDSAASQHALPYNSPYTQLNND
jgi:hypothetical protein